MKVTGKFGIYQIRNLINGKIYVGSTVNKFYRRWCAHKGLLNKNKHDSIKLQRGWNKYGKENFVFEILEVVEDKNKVIEREQFYIDTLKPWYNVRLIAESNFGTKRTKEQNIANSIRKIGNKNRCIRVCQVDKNTGKVIKFFPSCREAERELKLTFGLISSCCNNYYYCAGGFLWIYKRNLSKLDKRFKEYQKTLKRHNIPVEQLDKTTGKVIKEFESITQACKSLSLETTNISAVCKGKLKSTGGFRWRYSNAA